MPEYPIQILLSEKTIKEVQARELSSTSYPGDPERARKALKCVSEIDIALRILKGGGYDVDPGEVVVETF